ncbi:hypothetical protein FOC4_g10011759 [Fusarium odoratissimum]|uniref:PiggyBac transposable element-derived protein domain-containing protein n=1 Tax=Fusarium oxysporum f. sp. cubense (strain race 4) TaxID=2502994 RepID=N1R604_FUSC4|nr:hypothetical protein FOC4_g10011759 [Fusarium odoratissimum]
MSSQKIQDYIDDNSFNTPPSKAAANDPTGVPNLPPEEGRGDDFQPFNLEYRDFRINPLPKEPLELFQLFIPISLVQSWIEYTNSWVAHLLENAVIDSWNTPLSEQSRILKWEGISTATAYVWLGVLIYLGIHREISLKDHWKAPSLGDQRPLHSIIKFMPLRKFELITRYFRTFDYTKLDVRDESDLPKTFQAAEEWSNHIQKVSIELYLPGTNLTVDECMVPFTGRSKETTLVKRLSTQTHHVFTDNLFSSPQLFRLLRQLGYGATGTARPNCGITTEMKHIKETGKLPDGTPLVYNEVYLIPTYDKKV